MAIFSAHTAGLASTIFAVAAIASSKRFPRSHRDVANHTVANAQSEQVTRQLGQPLPADGNGKIKIDQRSADSWPNGAPGPNPARNGAAAVAGSPQRRARASGSRRSRPAVTRCDRILVGGFANPPRAPNSTLEPPAASHRSPELVSNAGAPPKPLTYSSDRHSRVHDSAPTRILPEAPQTAAAPQQRNTSICLRLTN